MNDPKAKYQRNNACQIFGKCISAFFLLFGSMVFVFLSHFCVEAFADNDSSTSVKERLNENVNISVPSKVNCFVKADGTLLAPSPSVLSLKNLSKSGIRITQISTTINSNWNITDEYNDNSKPNSISLSVIPSEVDDEMFNTVSTENNEVSTTVADGSTTVWRIPGIEDNEEDNKETQAIFEIKGETFNVLNNSIRGSGENVSATRWYVVSDAIVNDYEQRISDIESGIDFLESALNNKTSTAVKGNAESDYRTGNVNLDYEDLGIVPVNKGGTGAANASNALTNLGAASSNSLDALSNRLASAETAIDTLNQSMNSFKSDIRYGNASIGDGLVRDGQTWLVIVMRRGTGDGLIAMSNRVGTNMYVRTLITSGDIKLVTNSQGTIHVTQTDGTYISSQVGYLAIRMY